jgi:adenylate kinase
MKLVFLGPPGAGKGTLATKASEHLRIPHISTGDLFRAAIKHETPLGLQVKSILAEGRLVPDDLTIALVEEKLGSDDAANGWILDGFPRTIAQAEALDGSSPPDRVVNFDVEDAIILSRLVGRLVCKNCGRVYHAVRIPPAKEGICDGCAGELYTRPDDSEAAIKTRLAAYRSQTAPLIDWYGARGRLVTIDGSGMPDEVYGTFKEILQV